MPKFSGRIIVSTAEANVRIDNNLVSYILNVGWTCTICTYFQQREWCGRDSSVPRKCLQIGDLTSYTQVIWNIYNDGDNTVDEEDDLQLLKDDNIALTPLKMTKKGGPAKTQKQNKSKYAATDTMIQKLRVRSVREVNENLCFWAQNRGCLHVHGKQYMAIGFLD